MPLFQLNKDDTLFPHVKFAEPSGLLAIGGDLSKKRLIKAYSLGIFPWFDEGSPLLWWSPDPRLVLFPKNLKISKSLKKTLKKEPFIIKSDSDFTQVINNCADIRKINKDVNYGIDSNLSNTGDGTWITNSMKNAYINLHKAGYAHSIEAWHKSTLVGGLYGLSLGNCFFGESMFYKKSDASKVCFIHLVQYLNSLGFKFIDCQQETDHLKSLGAVSISRNEFMLKLKDCLKQKTILGSWQSDFDDWLNN